METGKLRREIALLHRRRFVVVSNRQPYAHVRRNGDARGPVRVEKPPSGLTLALEPILQATRGAWIAASSGNADREFCDSAGRVVVPPPGVRYALRRLFLPPRLRADYYGGFANSTLWPLCHIAYHQPRFEERWWRAYQRANRLFCDAVAQEIGHEPAVVFVQDFHLALLPALLRERCPNALVAQFWHIPWPNPEAFRICPWRQEILRGLLGNHLLGFHLAYHCRNFLETVDRELQVRLDRETDEIVSPGGRTAVAAFPVGVDYGAIHAAMRRPPALRAATELRAQQVWNGERLILSVERLDYSKGILERLAAIRRLFERWPQYRGRVRFVHIATPSRTDIAAYRSYAAAVERAGNAINAALGTPAWRPIEALHRYVEPEKVWQWYRAADIVVVSSLHDGMNLVAKEFVAAGRDDAILLLSEFTGAARELREALPINPFATDDFAAVIAQALEMPPSERRSRMRRLKYRVSQSDIGVWAIEVMTAIRQHEFNVQPRAPRHSLPVGPPPAAVARGGERPGPTRLRSSAPGGAARARRQGTA